MVWGSVRGVDLESGMANWGSTQGVNIGQDVVVSGGSTEVSGQRRCAIVFLVLRSIGNLRHAEMMLQPRVHMRG